MQSRPLFSRNRSVPRFTFPMAATTILVLTIASSYGLHVWHEQICETTKSPFAYVHPDTEEEKAAAEKERKILAGGRTHKRLQMMCDIPGVEQPTLYGSDEVVMRDSTAVVGIEVNQECCAFVLESMEAPVRHIVNMSLGGKPVSVTYCSLVDCVRVLKDDGDSMIPLHVGGLDVDNQMVFLFCGERYGQESADLPLKDHPFTRTSFGEWKTLHPTTRVYAGELRFVSASES